MASIRLLNLTPKCTIQSVPKISKFPPFQFVKFQEQTLQTPTHNKPCLAQISSLCKSGRLSEAVDFLTEMDLHNFTVGADVYGELLQGCVYDRNLLLGQQFHSKIIKLGQSFSKNEFIESKLLILYAKCNLFDASRLLFSRLGEKNVFSYAAIIGLYSRLGFGRDALLGFVAMHEDGILGDSFIIPNVLKACGAMKCVEFGKCVHGYVTKLGLADECVYVNSSLVDMYGKCGLVCDARKVFDGMNERNVVAWNSMIVSYVQNGCNREAIELFYHMCVGDVEPTRVTVSSFLSASANLGAVEEGKQGHGIAVLNGMCLDVILGSSIVNFYAKVGLFEDAEVVFDRMVEKDEVMWILLISSYVKYGFSDHALGLCNRMRAQGFMFDSVTLSSILNASADTEDIRVGKEGHCYCIKRSYESNVVIASSIVDMYAKCGRIQDARRVFDSTAEKDIVMWNTMLGAYAELGLSGETMKLFYQMQLEEFPQNVVTWNSIFLGFLRNGQVSEALAMFVEMQEFEKLQPNLVTYTTLISVLAQNGCGNEAIMMFHEMLRAGLRPNALSLSSALSACSDIASSWYGRAIHRYSIRKSLNSSVSVATSLVDIYAKCGNLKQAKSIFDTVSTKELPLYNVMIHAYALNSCSRDALALYRLWQDEGLKPDSVTFTNVLSFCSHGGLVHEGFKILHDMVSLYSLTPSIEHYGCIVTLLSRLGNWQKVVVIQGLPVKPDAYIWGSLLAACQELNETRLGELISDHLISTEPDNAGSYVTVSNAYANAGRWNEVSKSRDLMRQKGLRKSPGCSWIQIGPELHVFVARAGFWPNILNAGFTGVRNEAESTIAQFDLFAREVSYIVD